MCYFDVLDCFIYEISNKRKPVSVVFSYVIDYGGDDN